MSTPTPGQRDVIHLLSRVEHHAVRRLAAALEAEAEGCSVEQWRALNFLAGEPGRTMTDLADYALLPGPTATKLIDRMVAENLVYRHPDPADRRRVLVYLAERGESLHARAAAIVHREEEALLSALDAHAPVSTGHPHPLTTQLTRLADALEPVARRAYSASAP